MSEWLSKQKPEAEVSDVLLDELMNNSIFGKRKVIGDTAVIQNFKYKTLRNYYESWYRPGLTAVAVVGDIDPVKVEKMIKSKFSGGMKDINRDNPAEHSIPDYARAEARVVINKDLQKPDLTMIQLVPLSEPVRKESEYYPYLQRTLLNRLFRNRLNALSFTNNSYAKGALVFQTF